MSTVKNAVFAAATPLVYTAGPTSAEAAPANRLAFQDSIAPASMPAGQPLLALSNSKTRQPTHTGQKTTYTATYTVNPMAGEPVAFWPSDVRRTPAIAGNPVITASLIAFAVIAAALG